ncbi:MAG: hypothetical protein IJC81_04335 [Clostridia bacterium]|nr:hypothetical protein [Clostridia bacterium]
MKKILCAIGKFVYKVSDLIERRFDFTLALRRKKDAKEPVFSVNVKGEIPREVVAIFAIVGVFAFLRGFIKLIRILKKMG